MTIPLIRRALEKRLALLTPVVATAYENVAFTPAVGVPYQAVTLMPATPDNSIMGSTQYLAIGLFQISLFYPVGTGPGAAQDRAELLKTHFKRGSTFVESGVSVLVTYTPAIASAMTDGDRFHVPITVRWQAFIAT